MVKHRSGTVIQCDQVLLEFIKTYEKRHAEHIIIKELPGDRVFISSNHVQTLQREFGEMMKNITYEPIDDS